MWLIYALLSAVFAALTAILAKCGVRDIDSNLAMGVRTAVVLVLTVLILCFTGKYDGLMKISRTSAMFLILSGLATGASWLFYFKALQIGDASRVAPVDKLSVVMTMILAFCFLGETADLKTIIGGILITGGAVLIAL